jgi:hypothetical protein
MEADGMAWVFEANTFEYDDWSPYAVLETDTVLVVKSEGDYFFAFNANPVADHWEPLPLQSDRPLDLARLRAVVSTLLRIERQHRDGGRYPADGWRRIDDYDTLWGAAQEIVRDLLRVMDNGAP